MWAKVFLLNTLGNGALAMIAIDDSHGKRGKRGFKHFIHLPALN